jgi:hypothetical protein
MTRVGVVGNIVAICIYRVFWSARASENSQYLRGYNTPWYSVMGAVNELKTFIHCFDSERRLSYSFPHHKLWATMNVPAVSR